MKRIFLILISSVLYTSCDMNSITGSGNIITEKRTVNHFDGINISGSIDVEVRSGEAVSVEVEADDNILPYIITEVANGMFKARYKSNSSFSNTHAKVYVTVPSLQKISISGSGNISSQDTIKNNNGIEFFVSGSGDIKMLTDAPSVKARISGSGNINLFGRTKNFEGSISGSGDLKCQDLLAENVTIKIVGSGTAHVFSSVSITAKTTGSGDIYYSGNPSITHIDKNASGDIRAEK